MLARLTARRSLAHYGYTWLALNGMMCEKSRVHPQLAVLA